MDREIDSGTHREDQGLFGPTSSERLDLPEQRPRAELRATRKLGYSSYLESIHVRDYGPAKQRNTILHIGHGDIPKIPSIGVAAGRTLAIV